MTTPFGTSLARDTTKNITVARIHYSADPDKDLDWAQRTKSTYQSPSLWDQDQEIKFDAFAGQLVFSEFQKEYTVIKPFPIPLDVTHYMGIDPHPRVPHACLWMYVNKIGDFVFYREFWPSRMYGKRGNIPEDDETFLIPEYAKTILWMEGEEPNLFAPNGYTDNQGRRQEIYSRVGDPAAKGWKSNRELGREEAVTFWDTYRESGIYLVEAKKDFQASRDLVGSKLKPKKYLGPDGETTQSEILIFDTCQELILQLQTNRYPTLTPGQTSTRDPIEKPIEQRRHMTDLMRYIVSSDPAWIDRKKRPKDRGDTPYSEIPGFRV